MTPLPPSLLAQASTATDSDSVRSDSPDQVIAGPAKRSPGVSKLTLPPPCDPSRPDTPLLNTRLGTGQPSPSVFGTSSYPLSSASTARVVEDCDSSIGIPSPPEAPASAQPKLSRRHSFDSGLFNRVARSKKVFPAGAPPNFLGTRRPKGSSGSDSSIMASVRGASKIQIVPIDHGLILPHFTSLDDVSCDWLHWKQCKAPLSPELKEYVASLDGRRDAVMLQHVLGDAIRMECLLTLRLCTLLLQVGVAAGLTLFDIGLMMCRDQDENKPSALELAIGKARRSTVTVRESLGLSHPRERGDGCDEDANASFDNNNNTMESVLDPAAKQAATWKYHDALVASFKQWLQPHIDAVLAGKRQQ